MTRHFFIDGKRYNTEQPELDRIMILAHDPMRHDCLVLLERDDGPDEVVQGFIPIGGGERFVTVPRGTWGG